ncbi:MAG TPA: zf-HC2 domain-containing protein [Candidatus Cybelea sp.]
MMTRCDCARAETLAGAIALGEADEAQRDAYRSHLATCERCRADLGGEREIERVMATVGEARGAERWEPDLRGARMRARARYGTWRWVAALAAAAALIVGVRALERPPSSTVVAQNGAATQQAAARAVAALNNQTLPRREHEAQSLAFAPTSSTMEFKLRLDGRGASRRCVVAKSSGSRALDEAVCAAALRTISTRR